MPEEYLWKNLMENLPYVKHKEIFRRDDRVRSNVQRLGRPFWLKPFKRQKPLGKSPEANQKPLETLWLSACAGSNPAPCIFIKYGNALGFTGMKEGKDEI